MSAPSVIEGFRRATRLYGLVVAVWLLSMAAFAPAEVVITAATGPTRADLPAGGIDSGEALVVFFELMRPVAVPLAVVVACGGVLLVAWCALWHAGCVRWWVDDDTGEASVARILGAGLPVWWRYARLALVVLVLQVVALAVPWLPLRSGLEERFLMPALVGGAVLACIGFLLVVLGGLRGAWRLGESGRRSALVAWCRGLAASVRQPLRSLLPLLVWAVPGLAMLLLPLALDGGWVAVALPAGWLVAAFCWVALHMSYAPPRPAAAGPAAATPEKAPGTPYVTTRFPTLHRDE